MRIWTRENLTFTSRNLWISLAITLPWLVLWGLGVVDPHHDWSALIFLASGVLAIAFVVNSLRKKERQVLFLFVDVFLAIVVLISPLVCIVRS